MKTSVTQEDVDAAIVETHFWKAGRKTTVGFARLSNGFEIIESSGCVSPENYDEKVGEEIVMRRIKDQIWKLLGFQLQSELAGTKLLGGKDEQQSV